MATKTSGFICLECGHKFRTVKAAEKAYFGSDGCPKCGGADIDLGTEKASPAPLKATAFGLTGEER